MNKLLWVLPLLTNYSFKLVRALGGRALKSVPSSRIPYDKYIFLKEVVRQKFNTVGIKVEYSYDLPGKLDFGDIDVYCSIPKEFNLRRFIETDFSSPEITAGQPASFAYPMDKAMSKFAQIDVIHCTNVEFAKLFYSYADLNMILSRCCKAHKLTYSSGGLYIVPTTKTIFGQRFDDGWNQVLPNYRNKIVLTTNPAEAAAFLGLSERFLTNSYSTKDEIVDDILQCRYVSSSLLFHNVDKWNKEPQKHILYATLIERLKADNFSLVEQPKCEDRQMEAIVYFDKVAELEKEKSNVRELVSQREIDLQRKEKYSGKLFVERGIKTPMISKFKNEFEAHIRKKYEVEDHGLWLDTASKDAVVAEVDQWLAEQQNQRA